MSNIVARFYEAMGLIFPDPGVQMPRLDVTAAMPACLLCEGFSRLPPAKVGWMGANGEDKRLFLICSDCGWDASVEALEHRGQCGSASTASSLTSRRWWQRAAPTSRCRRWSRASCVQPAEIVR
jgi:hypothetical protein